MRSGSALASPLLLACLLLGIASVCAGHLGGSITGVTGASQVSQEPPHRCHRSLAGVTGAMAPKSVKDKRWRDALNKVTLAVKKLLLKPNIPEDAPEDSKYMDVGAYFVQKYPTPADQQAYYMDLVNLLSGLGGPRPSFQVAPSRPVSAYGPAKCVGLGRIMYTVCQGLPGCCSRCCS